MSLFTRQQDRFDGLESEFQGLVWHQMLFWYGSLSCAQEGCSEG